METLTMPLSGRLLVSHLAAYGLAFALEAAGRDAWIGHDPFSQSFEPIVRFDGDWPALAEAVRASAVAAEALVEADIEPGKHGNDRRPVIWARASFAKEPERAAWVQAMRAELAREAEARPEPVNEALLAALGAPATWGPETVKPSHGATALDGVLGNHTSDLVRGVLRPSRKAVATADPSALDREWWTITSGSASTPDKTGWAPPETRVHLVHQWLAVLGLSVLPVGHQAMAPSRTPATWTQARPRRHGVTLPLLDQPVSLPRLRALLALESLASVIGGSDDGRSARATAELRSMDVREVVAFERRYAASAGSSVAFSHELGRRVPLG